MTPSEFRRDPRLRACGYDLLAWAPLHTALSVPAFADAAGGAWPARTRWLLIAVVGVTGLLAAAVNRRRTAKMMGPSPAGRTARPSVHAWWGSAAATALVLDGFGVPQAVLPVWMLVLGAWALRAAGRELGELSRFGRLAVVAGCASALSGVVVDPRETAWLPPLLWIAVMVAAAGATAVLLNRRYAWALAAPGAQ